MVRSSNVPRELWVLRVVASKGVEYVFGLPVLAVFALAYAKPPNHDVLLLPLGMLLEAVLLVGLGLILAPATVLFRDLERIVPIILRVLFYGSPVLYSISNLPPAIRSVFTFNPTVGFLTLTHVAFFPAALHERRVVKHTVNGHVVSTVQHVNHWPWVLNSAIASLVILGIGIVVFVRLERSVLKEI
jgi:ABC-2 type transport system permease protein